MTVPSPAAHSHPPHDHDPPDHRPHEHRPHGHRPHEHAPPEVVAWVGEEPVPFALLQSRLDALRAGSRAALLPVVGTGEDRQLRRWVTQVLVTEALCIQEATRLALGPPPGPVHLGPSERIELGSIVAAAWLGCPQVRAVYEHVTTATPAPPPTPVTGPLRYRVRHAVTSGPDTPAEPEPMGWVHPDDLPPALGSALDGAAPGTVLGPLRSALGWHTLVVDEVDRPHQTTRTPDTTGALRRHEFLGWLAVRRKDLVREVPGFEHPGDPTQPDNTHRH